MAEQPTSIAPKVNHPGRRSQTPGWPPWSCCCAFTASAPIPNQIRHQFGGVRDRRAGNAALRQGIRAQGAHAIRSNWERLAKTPLPGIAVLRDGGFLLLGKAGDDQVLVQDPLSPRPTLMSRAEFEADLGRPPCADDAARRAGRSVAPLRHHLVSRRHPQIPPSARRGAGRLVLPAAVRAGLAAVLPGRHRQGAGASQPEHARRAGHRPGRDRRCSRRFSARCAPIFSRTRPTASTSSSAPGCSAICWRCRLPISRRGASAIRWRACASWRTSAISSPARR